MSDFITYRLRYSKIFVVAILTSLLLILSLSLPSGFTNFEENLPGRKLLIEGFTMLRLKLGDRVFAQALVGKDGWLEYTSAENLDFFQNTATLPVGGLENTQSNLRILYDELSQRNITLILVIVPNKATIYPDKLPDEIQKIGTQSELDMLADLLEQQGPPVLIDLRPALQKARQKRDIYYKTNTHWNGYGAAIAYREILKKLSGDHPEIAAKHINDFTIKTGQPSLHDIAALMGANHLLETNYTVVPVENNVNWITYSSESLEINPLAMRVATSSHDKLPKLLMYYDSFGVPLIPLLAPHFSQSTFIPNSSSYPGSRTFKQIEASKPDIIILEFVERYQPRLYRFLNKFELEAK
jgi:alginate O-acetyltransferase complex protein AlgJ